ncbi:MAG: hypothetical protein RL417_1839 [Pseudomonadota bacterium]|jgi:glucose-6-phosphate dehydrogenase assembly protein OpcA
MAAAEYAYTPTSPGAITKALGDVFAAMESAGQRFNRSANTNVIVAVSSVDSLRELETSIDSLSLVHPSRFFVVYIDDKLKRVETAISARCHGLSRSEHACSEVVRIGTPRADLWLVPSIIRGNFMVGMPAELYLADGDISQDLVDKLSPLADLVIFDSGDFSSRLDILAETARFCSNLLDLEWVELGPWRDEIKGAFARGLIRDLLPDLTAIVVRASGGVGNLPSFGALLLGGWMVDRLGLSHLLGRHGDIHAQLPGGRHKQVSLRFEGCPGEGRQIEEVTFLFESAEGKSALRLVRDESIEVSVEGARKMHWSRPVEDESRDELIRRYFLIGESTANYNAALRVALHLRNIE